MRSYITCIRVWVHLSVYMLPPLNGSVPAPPPQSSWPSLSVVIILRVARPPFFFFWMRIWSSKVCCPTRYLFLFSPSLAASRHLQSKDEICVEFIKGYSADCKKKKKKVVFFFTFSPFTPFFWKYSRDISAACHAVRSPPLFFFAVCFAQQSIKYPCPHVSCIIYQEYC